MTSSLINLFNENLGAIFSPKSLTEWKPRDPESFTKLGPKCAIKTDNVSSKERQVQQAAGRDGAGPQAHSCVSELFLCSSPEFIITP